VVEHLSSKHEALSSNLSTAPPKKIFKKPQKTNKQKRAGGVAQVV
jgi:hypothetical protein